MKIKPIAPNHSEVEISPALTVFFSYQTPVAALKNGIYYRTEKRHSNTTTRHLNKWLDGVNAEIMPQAWFDSLTA
jgi:hypothetical protein